MDGQLVVCRYPERLIPDGGKSAKIKGRVANETLDPQANAYLSIEKPLSEVETGYTALRPVAGGREKRKRRSGRVESWILQSWC